MAFFKQFPKVQYDFERNGIVQNVVNIYRSVRPLQNFIDDSTAYTFYEIKVKIFWSFLFWSIQSMFNIGRFQSNCPILHNRLRNFEIQIIHPFEFGSQALESTVCDRWQLSFFIISFLDFYVVYL